MRKPTQLCIGATILVVLGLSGIALAQRGPTSRPLDPNLPTLWIVGDSTANSGGDRGWGNHAAKYFDTSKINVANRAVAGRSSRTFITTGLWDPIIAQVKAGDFLILQMGHNDADPINTDKPGAFAIRARGTLPGIGDESEEIDNGLTHQHETVHTFGWYMRRFINESKAKGATPILASLTIHNEWKDGKVERDYRSFATFARDLAKADNVLFVDLNNIAGDAFEEMGPEKVKPLFPQDNVHNAREGSDLNAQFMVAGLKGLPSHPLDQYLNDKGKSIAANSKYVLR